MITLNGIIDESFSGCVFVQLGKDVIVDKSYGYADMANKIPNQTNTRFATASAGKVFVAVSILQLIENGRLGFEDRLGDLLDFDLKDIDPNITVRQLLTHTSGIPDYFDESTMNDYCELWQDYPNYKIRRSMDLVPLFIDKPMMYNPGERFQYNNTGFVVLGLIIEKITGLFFDAYIKENVFDPCNMTDSGYYELDRLPERCANAYIYDHESGQFYTNIYSVDVKGTGAGGAFTSPQDIRKFWDCLLSDRLISKEMRLMMLSPQIDNEYGLGMWMEKENENHFNPYFQGCDPGVSFISSYDLEKELLITIVSNLGQNVWKMKEQIQKRI